MKGIMQALKDNTSLRFAVITGCLKIAKESIFTGTNNFISDTISDSRLNEYWGFTPKDVDKLLKDSNFEDLFAPLPDGLSALMIPNAEILEIFESTIVKWFDGLMTMPKPGIARIFFMLSGMLTAKPDP